MIVENLIPNLRFPEFHKPLVKGKIRDFSSVRSGSTPLRSISAYFKDGDTPWVKTTDLNNGLIVTTEESVTELALNETSLRVNPPNSVLIAMYGGFKQIGRTGILGKPAATNQALSVLNVDESYLVPKYLQHYLNAKVSRWRMFAASSRKDPNITSSDVGAFPVFYCCIFEQQKVADFLTAVDSKISLLTEKHRLLKAYKKGVMQQLFSQKIRFKDYDGKAFPDWEEKTIGHIMTESRIKGNGGDIAKKLTVKIWGKGVVPKKEDGKGSENTQYYKRKAGQFIYGKLDFLNCAFAVIPNELDGYESTLDLPSLDVCPSVNKYFVLEIVKQKRFYKRFGEIADGSRKAKRINVSVFQEMPITLPSIDEQNKIMDCLNAIDKKIHVVTEQIEQTKQFKKGLLQQMFV